LIRFGSRAPVLGWQINALVRIQSFRILMPNLSSVSDKYLPLSLLKCLFWKSSSSEGNSPIIRIFLRPLPEGSIFGLRQAFDSPQDPHLGIKETGAFVASSFDW